MQHTFLIPCHMCGRETALHALRCVHCGCAPCAPTPLVASGRSKSAILIGIAAALVLVGLFADEVAHRAVSLDATVRAQLHASPRTLFVSK